MDARTRTLVTRNPQGHDAACWSLRLVLTRIFAWGCSYYLPAVLAKPITAAPGWPLTWVVGWTFDQSFARRFISQSLVVKFNNTEDAPS
jgi:hypothetical protein